MTMIVAASGNGDLDRLTGPLMILPHGAGYSRVLAPSQSAPAGPAPSQLVRDGRVIAQVIGLEHEDQLPRLAAYCPEAAKRERSCVSSSNATVSARLRRLRFTRCPPTARNSTESPAHQRTIAAAAPGLRRNPLLADVRGQQLQGCGIVKWREFLHHDASPPPLLLVTSNAPRARRTLRQLGTRRGRKFAACELGRPVPDRPT